MQKVKVVIFFIIDSDQFQTGPVPWGNTAERMQASDGSVWSEWPACKGHFLVFFTFSQPTWVTLETLTPMNLPILKYSHSAILWF